MFNNKSIYIYIAEHKANVQLPYWWITTRFNSGSDGKIVLLPINGDG